VSDAGAIIAHRRLAVLALPEPVALRYCTTMIRLHHALAVAALVTIACSTAPADNGLRDSFASQLAANTFISGFQRSGDDMTFRAPRPDGTPSTWRVHIDKTAIETQPKEKQPYKGTVQSSWYVNGEKVNITGADSNLPLELTSNGLSQECWAFWETDQQRWSWE
jgi:hypothetical protein